MLVRKQKPTANYIHPARLACRSGNCCCCGGYPNGEEVYVTNFRSDKIAYLDMQLACTPITRTIKLGKCPTSPNISCYKLPKPFFMFVLALTRNQNRKKAVYYFDLQH